MNSVNAENWKRGYDAGYSDGMAQRNVDAMTTGFWFGIGTAALLVLIVTLTILMGKI